MNTANKPEIVVVPVVRLKVRLIDNWRSALKFWSVRFGLAGMTIYAVLQAVPGFALDVWNVLPDSLKDWVPSNFINWVPLSLFVAGQVARIVWQKNDSNP